VRLEILDAAAIQDGGWAGSVLCHDVPGADGRPVLRKGHRLDVVDSAALSRAAPEELHIVWLGEEDVDENTAAIRLAQAVAGPGVEIHPPIESQARLSAAGRGVARVDAATLAAVNGVEGVTVFTIPDGAPVELGRTVAGVKITSLAIPGRILEEAELTAASAPHGPAVAVRGFLPLRVSAVVRRPIDPVAQQRFEASLRRRVDWFGGVVGSIECLDDRAAAEGALLTSAANADLVIVVGLATVDPLEGTWRGLLDIGAEVIRRGLPVHPGSSYWLVRLGGVPVIGVASCGMVSRRSALDLLLMRCFAGEPLDREYLASLGHGGLLQPEGSWRIPAYDRQVETDER
jgi:hypothetical protein